MEWLPITGTPYEVSSCGQVREGPRILKAWPNGGYMLVRLSKPVRTIARVHRLVAQAFLPNPDNKPFVNHMDCNPANNAKDNLEWCTQEENLRHSQNLGRMQRNYWSGKRSPNSALSDAQVREIRRLYARGGTSLERLGRLFEVSKRCVGRIVNQETYQSA